MDGMRHSPSVTPQTGTLARSARSAPGILHLRLGVADDETI
jgi:hypothetical protein